MSGAGGTLVELPWPPSALSGHHSVQTERLYADYLVTGSVWKTAERFGLTGTSVWGRFKRAGLSTRGSHFSDEENGRLRRDYRKYVDAGRLDALAAEMGRTKMSLCERAKALGLTDAQAARIKGAKAAKAKCTGVPKWSDKPHPRGMLGKRHSEETKGRLGDASSAWWESLTRQQREAQVTNSLKAALAKNGRLGPVNPNRETTWKAGWREIADKRHYFRSRWEANYARYLQWLKERGDIVEWEYEPETFWFDAIKRGVRSYRPDFRVHELNGSKPLHEVKGWMCPRSKTTLKRMAKYHPQETIILIREKEYKAISRFAALIGGWE